MTAPRLSIARLAERVAHDLNSPLCAVLGNLDLMAEKLGGGAVDPDAAAALTEMTTDARDAARRLGAMIDELSLMARLDDGGGATDGHLALAHLLASLLARPDAPRLNASADRTGVHVELHGAGSGELPELALARQLCGALNAPFELAQRAGTFSCRLHWPR